MMKNLSSGPAGSSSAQHEFPVDQDRTPSCASFLEGGAALCSSFAAFLFCTLSQLKLDGLLYLGLKIRPAPALFAPIVACRSNGGAPLLDSFFFSASRANVFDASLLGVHPKDACSPLLCSPNKVPDGLSLRAAAGVPFSLFKRFVSPPPLSPFFFGWCYRPIACFRVF